MDEASVAATDLVRPYVYSPVGQRAQLPGGYGRAQDICSEGSYSLTAMIGLTDPVRPVVFDIHQGPSTAHTFLRFVINYVLPVLPYDCFLVMDGARYHVAEWSVDVVKDLLALKRCRVIVLPAYSPELNPIELVFAQMRKLLQRFGCEGWTLFRTLVHCLHEVSFDDVLGYYSHCSVQNL